MKRPRTLTLSILVVGLVVAGPLRAQRAPVVPLTPRHTDAALSLSDELTRTEAFEQIDHASLLLQRAEWLGPAARELAARWYP